jgi:hypothetical protein
MWHSYPSWFVIVELPSTFIATIVRSMNIPVPIVWIHNTK